MNKKVLILMLVLLVSAATAEPLKQTVNVNKPKLSAGITLGTNGGVGGEIHGMVSNLTPDMPLNLRFSFGYSSLKPGVSAEARRIFINDATNGVPEENGYKYDYKFDLVFPFKILSLKRSYLYGGPRYSKFVANFKYIGGNEDFDITSDQWGLGLGLKAYFAMGNRFDFVTSAGIDYYFSSELSGHDTRYSPDGEDVNARNDYTFDDADNAINNPTFQLRFLVGVNYHF